MYNIKDKFMKTDETGFPVSECTNKTGESSCFEGNRLYTCLVIDTRFPGNYEIVHGCKPYTCRYKEEILFGWTDANDQFIDNLYHCIHMDNRVVIGCIREEKEKTDIEKEWEEYRFILDSQWE